MKHLRKSILTLLALTLFGGAGAWAQGPTNVTEITADLIASWQGVNENITLADLQALGLEAVDASVAQAWTGAPQSGMAVLIYGFDGGYFTYILFDDGHANLPSHTSYTKRGLYGNVAPNGGGVKHFYTSAPAAIELTKEGANQWTLGQAPDYDLELQVEYYQKYALKEIPAGWTVKINGHEQPKPYQGDSLMITETDSVTLVPPAELKNAIKSVTLADEGPAVQTVIIGGVELQVVEGETWRQIAQRNSGVITADDYDDGYVYRDHDTVLRTGTAYLRPTDTYNSSLDYYWYEY